MWCASSRNLCNSTFHSHLASPSGGALLLTALVEEEALLFLSFMPAAISASAAMHTLARRLMLPSLRASGDTSR